MMILFQYFVFSSMNDEIDLLDSLHRTRLSSSKLSNMSSAMSGNLDSNSSMVQILGLKPFEGPFQIQFLLQLFQSVQCPVQCRVIIFDFVLFLLEVLRSKNPEIEAHLYNL